LRARNSQSEITENNSSHLLQRKVNEIFEILLHFTCFKPRRSFIVFGSNLHCFHISQSVQ